MKERYIIAYSFLIAFSLLVGVTVQAQTKIENAQWIGLSGIQSDTNTWTAYRKTFSLNQLNEKVIAKIATDSKYWLWINGRLVVFEGALKRGPNPKDTYYDTVNIAPFLKKGDNTIALLTWFWGRDGFNHKNSGQSALWFQAAIGSHLLVSDTSWKTRIHPAFGNTGPPLPNYRLPEFNIYFDAQKDIEGWNQPAYDDRHWTNAQTFGVPPIGPWHQLIERPIPLWKDEGLKNYETDFQLPMESNGKPIVASLPKNATITPYLKVDAPAGLKIDIRTDNYKGGSEYNVRTEYITKQGEQEFETFGYMNGHQVLYSIPAGIKILSLKYRETRYNTEQVGQFWCNDSFYNRLWQKAYNTLIVNMRDAIQDPDRERAQWWGDAVILSGEIFYATDRNGILAIQKAIHNLVDWQKPDGVLYSPIPSGNWDKELPTQMLASIGEYGFWNYYKYTGDRALIQEVYSAVKKYMSLWSLDNDGLVIHRKGGWDWLDWGSRIDTAIIDNAWYYMALKAAQKMAVLTGQSKDAQIYKAQLKSIEENFNKKYWDGKGYKTAAYNGYDDRGNGLAVVTGLASQAQFLGIKQILQTTFNASPYFEKYVLEACFIMKDANLGLERMKTRYTEMVSSPLSTLWEGWGIGNKGYGGGSYNHGWAGGPLTLLSQYIAGVTPGEPGYRSVNIKPIPGLLDSVDCIVPTVKGKIGVRFKKSDNFFSVYIQTPANMGTIFWLPKIIPNAASLSIDGKLFLKNGKQVTSSATIKLIGTDKHNYIFRMSGGGIHSFYLLRH